MSKRLIIETVEPAAINTLMQLEAYLSTVSVSKRNMELMKIRASQINGCTYCINMHTEKALKNGETQQRIDSIGNWREASVFNDEERLLFAITEEITLISNHGLSDQLYTDAESLFGQRETAQIIMIVIVINAWNRLAVSLKTEI